MLSYNELVRENNYLRGCLSFDEYVYAVCIGDDGNEIRPLGCIKFLNGIDHWRNRDKMFANIDCRKYWVLVEKDVYIEFKRGKDSFLVR